MPIARLLADSQFTSEQRHVLELAFNATLTKLGLVDRNDPICDLVARKIIKIAEEDATNVVAITELAFGQLCPQPSSSLDD